MLAILAMTGPSLANETRARESYTFRAVRVDSPIGAILYRLEVETGEVCAFSFARNAQGELRGCEGREEIAGGHRFDLDAVARGGGAGQSSAYRLDRITGELCRFRLKGIEGDSLEPAGCIGRNATP